MRIKPLFSLLLFFIPLLTYAQEDSVPDIKKLLGLSLEELMNIKVVTATGAPQTISEAPSTMNVITAKQIRERGYEQLEDALRDIPGIDLIHLNGYVPTLIYFRGMYGAENLRALLMINGIAENNIIGSNDMAGPAYSLHNVERIEIIWGPASALYGANAFGGIINIITKTGSQVNGFSYEKGYGSFNTSVDKVLFGINRSKFDIALSGSMYSTDGPKFSNRDPNYTASYVDKAYSINGIISYTGKKLKSTFGARIYNTPMGYGTFLNSPTVFLGLPSQGYGNSGILGLVARDVRGEKSGLEELFSRSFYLEEELKPTSKLNLHARLIFRESGISEKSYAYITLDGHKLYRVPTANYSNRVEGDLSMNYTTSKIQFAAGLQFFQDNIEKGGRKFNVDSTTVYLLDGRDTLLNLYSTFKERQYDIRNNFGSFIQLVWNADLFRKTSFTLGARYDYNDYYGNPVSPRFAIVSQPNDQFTVKLLFGTAYRAPTNTEIYQAPANLKLLTEKSRTYEVNLLYRPSKKILFQLNGFHNDLKDVIVYGNLVNLNQDKNPGKIWITGIETKVDMEITGHFSGFANFTYQHPAGKNLITGFEGNVPDVAKVKGNIGLQVRKEGLFTFNVTGNWVGERPTPRTDPYGPVAGYFLTNCTISTERFFDKRVSLSFTVHNLFNTKYLDPGIRSADGFIYSTVLEQPGINGLLKIGINIK